MRWAEQLRLWRLHLKRLRRNRRFRGRTEVYIVEELASRLELRAWTLLSDHYKRKLYLAETPGGRALLKVYDGKTARLIPRCLALDPLLRAEGLLTPKILFADAGKPTAGQYGLGCLVMEWIGTVGENVGRPPQPTTALENLARIHRIEASRCRAGADEEPIAKLPSVCGPRWAVDSAVKQAMTLHGTYFPIPRTEADNVLSMLRAGNERLNRDLRERPAGDTLLHLDYSPRNLIADAQGRAYTLDFEEARFGWFGFDLALALLHFGHGFDADSLTDAPVGRLGDDGRSRPLVEAYFAARPEADRDAWEAHRPWVMAWAYLRVIANLAKRSSNPFRYRFADRRRFGRIARRRWQCLTRSAVADQSRAG
jgi:aminoglycoside/choline kinase family phosphotransferase